MSDHGTDDGAPDWYVAHFLFFGYTADDLVQRWARLPEPARERYRASLAPRVSVPVEEGAPTEVAWAHVASCPRRSGADYCWCDPATPGSTHFADLPRGESATPVTEGTS